MSDIQVILQSQRDFFKTETTLSVDFRIEQLMKLKEVITQYEYKIEEALYLDLNKDSYEAYMCEVGMTLNELNHMIKNIKKYSKKRVKRTPLSQFASTSYELKVPYGNVLIMSPWNYPFLLTMGPLIDALAAGNTVIIKPSNYSSHTSKVIYEMISTCFDSSYVACVQGGREQNQELLNHKFDFIFFTGSQNVGKVVLSHAAKFITPVVLELGGKSPCIVDESANIELSAKRIIFGKLINSGQTCVAPDYILCHKEVKESLVKELIKQIQLQITKDPLNNAHYPKIINQKHFERIIRLIDEKKCVYGGKYDKATLKIEPTIMDGVTIEDAVMQEEIFGPILPILTYENIDEVIESFHSKEKPLALYLFSNNKENIHKVTTQIRYGGGCINDCIIHLVTTEMGFGGVGESGMGAYHGKVGFDTFSHTKSMVDKKNWIDLPMRYHPYKEKYKKLVKMFLG